MWSGSLYTVKSNNSQRLALLQHEQLVGSLATANHYWIAKKKKKKKKKTTGFKRVEKTESLSHICKFLFVTLEMAFMVPAWCQRWLSLGFLSLVTTSPFSYILWAKDDLRATAHRQSWKCGSLLEIFLKLPLPSPPSTTQWCHSHKHIYLLLPHGVCGWYFYLIEKEDQEAGGRNTASLLWDLGSCVFLSSLYCDIL